MALNKQTIRYSLLLLVALLISLVFLHQCKCSHYKIGPSGEYGEITILRDYVILGHHSLLFAPRSNYIRIPIKYDSSALTIEVMSDSIIHIAGHPDVMAYELSNFKEVDFNIAYPFEQKLREHAIVMRCIISTYGYGLYPTFYYCLSDSTIIRQKYLQRFPFESPNKWCYYDTIR